MTAGALQNAARLLRRFHLDELLAMTEGPK